MSVRTAIDIGLRVGRNNDLTQSVFDGSLSFILDTLADAKVRTLTLAPGEANAEISFDPIEESRLLYVEATGPIRVTPGGGLATAAMVTGDGATFPFDWAAAAELHLEIDGTAVTVVNVDEELTSVSLAKAVLWINLAAMNAGIVDGDGNPTTIAREHGGQVRIVSPSVGVSSTVRILGSSDATLLSDLGLTAGLTTGQDPQPGQSPLDLPLPVSGGAQAAGEAKSFLLATLRSTSLTIENMDSDNTTHVTVLVAGGLLDTPAGC
jgi:hypothetical protein